MHHELVADDGVTVVTPGSTGAAGAITIAADAIVNGDPAAGPGLIAASGFDGPNTAPPLGQASPGQITITDVNQDGGGALRNNGTIIAGTAGSANAGAVTLNLASVANTTTGTISAGSFLTIAGPGIVTNPNIGGAAGEVDIRAALLANAGTIAVDTAGTGVGGVIMIDTTQSGVAAACPGMAANCALNTGTIIADSEATASGDGGTITITTAALVNGVAGTTGAGVISASGEKRSPRGVRP